MLRCFQQQQQGSAVDAPVRQQLQENHVVSFC
jgi:hypothetical protein